MTQNGNGEIGVVGVLGRIRLLVGMIIGRFKREILTRHIKPSTDTEDTATAKIYVHAPNVEQM